MTEPAADPRVYFAAERTLLAWLRTGIAIMAFGFVVARFGLFLRLLVAHGDQPAGHGLSPYLGAALVGLGVAATAGGVLQYQRFCQALLPSERPRTLGPRLVTTLGWLLVLVGFVLGIMVLV